MNTSSSKSDSVWSPLSGGSLLRLATLAAFSATILLETSCVSVNIGGGQSEKSKGVEFKAPGGAFQPLKEKKADQAWVNKDNGNSISYLSICNDPADPTLEAVSQELFVDLQNLKVLASNKKTFNGREALEMEVEGQLDGVPTKVQSVVFKKNDCLYTLSYIGVSPRFEEDKAKFQDFKGSFQAP